MTKENTRPRYNTLIPDSLLTPPVLDVNVPHINKLRFVDGVPTQGTVEKLYNHLDYIRSVDAYLLGIPAASMVAMREGMRSIGAVDGKIAVFEKLMDSNVLYLTPNTESIYTCSWIDLKDGPIIVESAPNTLGIVNDMWFRYVTDMGNAGPDKGKGGTFAFFPPTVSSVVVNEYQRANPDHFAIHCRTFGNSLIWRGFVEEGADGLEKGVANIVDNTKIYPLDGAPSEEDMFLYVSGKTFNTIHSSNALLFDEVHQVIEEEPVECMDPETLGIFAAIGIQKGVPYVKKEAYEEAAKVGCGIARALIFAPRDPEAFLYHGADGKPTSQWKTAFIGGNHEFLKDGCRLLDARAMFYFYATYATPAMVKKGPGDGSVYAYIERDDQGEVLSGNKHYTVTLPYPLPADDFWSLVLYDCQTRSMLQTEADSLQPSINSQRNGEDMVIDGEDGNQSVTIHIAPQLPDGVAEANFIQTRENKNWHAILRLYGPGQEWFDKAWQPGEVVEQV